MNHHQELVLKIIDNAEHYNWSLQGFGMFRLYLSKTVRLHVWLPSFIKEAVSTIHNHPWDFESTVIFGKITNYKYITLSINDEIWKDFSHMKQEIICGPNGCSTDKLPKKVLLQTSGVDVIRAGSIYNMRKDEIHETRASEGTITIINRKFYEDTEHADVFYPIGQEWISAIPHEAREFEIQTMKQTIQELYEPKSDCVRK